MLSALRVCDPHLALSTDSAGSRPGGGGQRRLGAHVGAGEAALIPRETARRVLPR